MTRPTTRDRSMQTFARLALATALAAAGLWMGADFIPTILWASVVAVAVDPLRGKLLARMPGRHSTVAGILALGVTLLVVVPLGLAVAQAIAEAQSLTAWITHARMEGIPVPGWVATLPGGREEVTAWWKEHLETGKAATAHMGRLDASTIIDHSKAIGHSLFERAIVFGFTVTALFFMIRDRDGIIGELRTGIDKTFGTPGLRIGGQVLASVRGTIDGLVLVGLAQGVIMSVIYLLAGVPHPILLGMLTGVGGMVPFGLLVVMLVALLMLLAQGAMVTAIVVGSIGFALNFVADHFVRPSLMGRTTRLPFMWVLIGIVGGVETIGLLGLFVGPAVMAALVLVWRDYIGEEPHGQE